MDKFIDKLIDTSWFMKVVALILALLLFDSVYDPDKDVSRINVPGEEDHAVLEDVPVKAYYDTENLVVTGIPETVTVTIDGPRANLQAVRTQRNFEVYIDLSEAEIGTQTVPIEIRDLSEKLDAVIEPAEAEVTVQERVTKDFKVEAEFDVRLLGEGFVAEQPDINPKTVSITGAKDVIERITYVKAALALKGPITETVKEEASISVLDKDMNKLDVAVEPAAVEITVPVKRLTKQVPVKIVEIGSPRNEININSISLEVDEVTISGKEEVLKETESVRVEVDVSSITRNTELTLPIIISEGITAVDPKQIKVKVDVSVQSDQEEPAEEEAANLEETKTYANLPISFTGLGEEYDASFKTPANGRTSITVTGRRSQIQALQASDFNLFLNLANLEAGDHQVKIVVDGPSEINWNLAVETATISITEKEA